MAEPCGLPHIFLQGKVLVGLHFQEPGTFLQRRVFQDNVGPLVEEQIDCHKHCQRHDFECGKKQFHPACVQGAVGTRDGKDVEEKEKGRQ